MTKSKGLYKKRTTGVTQVAKCFKLDKDLEPMWESIPNKARYLNDLIRKDMQK